MANLRSLGAAAIAPVVLGTLMSARGCSMNYHGPQLLLWIAFCLTFFYIFFWLCLLITNLVCARFKVTGLPNAGLINGAVAFVMSSAFMSITRAIVPKPRPDWIQVAEDALMLAVACGISYLIYRVLRRRPADRSAAPGA
jgi:hypothetical protein